VEDAIEILEHVLKVREEEKLGTANPDVGGAAGRAAERGRAIPKQEAKITAKPHRHQETNR
jgi:hypothetical protein